MTDATAAPTIRCGARMRVQAESHERAGRLAAAIVAAGIGRGDRVAVMARNDIEFLEVSLAIASAGANPVPVNTRWQAREVAHLLGDSRTRLVIAHTEFVPVVESAVAQAGISPLILEIGMPEELLVEAALAPELAKPTGRYPTVNDWLREHPEPLGYVEGAIADSMGLIYTSGTTGTPKGVVRDRMTPSQLLAIAGGTAQRMGLAPGGRSVAGPLYQCRPNAVTVLALRMGTNITIMPRWDSERFLQHVDERKIQQAKVVPTMLSRLLSLPARYATATTFEPDPPHPLLRTVPARDQTRSDRVVRRCTVGVLRQYRMRDHHMDRASEWLARPGSVGRPVDGSAVLVADESGHPSTPGTTGRVYVRGADHCPFQLSEPGHGNRPRRRHAVARRHGTCGRTGLSVYDRPQQRSDHPGWSEYLPGRDRECADGHRGGRGRGGFGIPDAGDMGESIAAHIVPRPGFGIAMDDLRTHLSGKIAEL